MQVCINARSRVYFVKCLICYLDTESKSKSCKMNIYSYPRHILTSNHPMDFAKFSVKKSLLESAKRRKMRWNRKRSVIKNHKHCSPLGMGVWRNQKLVGGRLHNPPLRLRGARLVSSFWDLEKKITYCDFTAFSPFDTRKSMFFRYSN